MSDDYGGMVQGKRSEEIQAGPEAARAYATKIPPRQGETMKGVPFEKHKHVRVGSIGIGGRGGGQECTSNELLGFLPFCYTPPHQGRKSNQE